MAVERKMEIEQTRELAMQWARENNANEVRALAVAEVWFDAVKGEEESTARALCSYLDKKFGQ